MKYIIDIPNGVEWGVVTCRTEDGFYTRDFDSLEELTSDYINEHFGSLQDDAYQKGFEDGKWKSEDGCTGCKYEGKVVTGPPCISCCNSYKNQWTAKDDKIEVGDEVRHDRGWTAVVTSIDNVGLSAMDYNGEVASYSDISKFTKTGRHFDIKSILEEMRHD